jgi:hypothetical protein
MEELSMKPDGFHDAIGKEIFQPFVIKTDSGALYPIRNQASLWLPDGYESTVVVAVPGKGITLLSIESIEVVHFEQEVASNS